MALPKVFGTETEYGFYIPARSDNDSLYRSPAEKLVARAIAAVNTPSIENAFDREQLDVLLKRESAGSLGRIKRFLEKLRTRADQGDDDKENELFRIVGLSGSMLANGARFYVDMGHPEYSTPECTSARELIAWYRAGDILVELGRRALEQELNLEVQVHKDNSDRAGHSYAAHENYLTDPATFNDLMTESPRGVMFETFLATRQLFAGAGKAGCEDEKVRRRYRYQLSQRADFISVRWGDDTTHRRSIVNTRDRAYADRVRFRRLHVIVGDANICDTALWLKVGITAMVLKMLEDDFPALVGSPLLVPLRNSVSAIKEISRNPQLNARVAFEDGRYATALDIQREFHSLLARYFAEAAAPNQEEQELLAEFGRVLDALGDLPNREDDLVGVLDWVTKKILLEELRGRGIAWDDPRMRIRDELYHNVNPDVGLWRWLEDSGYLKRLVSDEEIRSALVNPPENTRAYLRGRCIAKFSSALRGAQWEYLFLSPDGSRSRSRSTQVLIDDPFCGNAAQVAAAIDAAESPAELLVFLADAGITVKPWEGW